MIHLLLESGIIPINRNWLSLERASYDPWLADSGKLGYNKGVLEMVIMSSMIGQSNSRSLRYKDRKVEKIITIIGFMGVFMLFLILVRMG